MTKKEREDIARRLGHKKAKPKTKTVISPTRRKLLRRLAIDYVIERAKDNDTACWDVAIATKTRDARGWTGLPEFEAKYVRGVLKEIMGLLRAAKRLPA